MQLYQLTERIRICEARPVRWAMRRGRLGMQWVDKLRFGGVFNWLYFPQTHLQVMLQAFGFLIADPGGRPLIAIKGKPQ